MSLLFPGTAKLQVFHFLLLFLLAASTWITFFEKLQKCYTHVTILPSLVKIRLMHLRRSYFFQSSLYNIYNRHEKHTHTSATGCHHNIDDDWQYKASKSDCIQNSVTLYTLTQLLLRGPVVRVVDLKSLAPSLLGVRIQGLWRKLFS